MGLKSLIAPFVHWAAHASGESARRALRQHAGRIITFHAVGVADCPAKVFEAQIRFLQQHFKIVSLATLVKNVREANPAIDGQVALTFDDGLRNNGLVAYPILKRLGAPATFFICPGVVDSGQWLWNQDCRRRLLSLSAATAAALADSLGHPGSHPVTVVDWMKTLPTPSRQHVEQIIRNATPHFQPRDSERLQNDLMTWEELKALDPELITLGAHSTNHPILANCTPGELIEEIQQCRTRLEKRIDRPVEFFCYPNGDFNPAVVKFAARTYTAAVTTRPGFVRPGLDLHQLPRLNTANNLSHFTWRLFRPSA
ncbi:MAG: polysaccharide deacetylase family protein [Proteobacteria bacterium]|nr:polysaccharide deacetylase family protein [Pseudomonadota bacterium]